MFETLGSRVLAVAAAAGLLTASFLFGFGIGRGGGGGNGGVPDLGLLEEAERQISAASEELVPSHELIQGAIRGMLEALGDPYAEYLDPATFVEFNDVLSGRFSGIGLVVEQVENFQTLVVSVFPGTPADDAGIKAGDIIAAVDGQNVEGLFLEQITARIKGEPGSKVKITVVRAGESLEFEVTRADITIPSVEHEMLSRGIGYIRVLSFLVDTPEKVGSALTDLEGSGARGLVLDLRGNPGGSLDSGVDVASVFLDGGVVVSYQERGREETIHRAAEGGSDALPMVVLIDERSASSAEIVAGALKDRGRAVLVGAPTYGKGSIQRVIPLSDGSAIKLTIASYRLPSGGFIGEDGIEPDIHVAGEAAQLARAREILAGMISEAPLRKAG